MSSWELHQGPIMNPSSYLRYSSLESMVLGSQRTEIFPGHLHIASASLLHRFHTASISLPHASAELPMPSAHFRRLPHGFPTSSHHQHHQHRFHIKYLSQKDESDVRDDADVGVLYYVHAK